MESIDGPSPSSSGKSGAGRSTPPLRKRLALVCLALVLTALLLEGGRRIFFSPPAPVASNERREHGDSNATQAIASGSPHEQGSAPVDDGLYVITRDQEQTMGQLLGMDGAMLGGCRLDDAQIEQTHVRATYKCAGDKMAGIELHHPSSHVTVLAKTAQFVISSGEPAPPAGLVEDLAQRIRSKEASFAWKDPSTGEVAPGTRRTPLILMAIAGGLLATLLFFLLRRAMRK